MKNLPCVIGQLLELEHDLNGLPASTERDAKLNMLKYLQVNQVKYYERLADGLYFELQREEGLDKLRTVREHNSVGCNLVQPREEGSIKDYLDDAALAMKCLNRLVDGVQTTAQGAHALRVVSPGVKSLESTTRKAQKAGGVRYLTDMARISVVCETSDGLACIFELLNDRAHVSPGGHGVRSMFGGRLCH